MPDYGHDLLFGVFLPPLAARADDVLRMARLTDELGLDLLTVQDHPYQPAFLDTWTLLSVIAAQTRRVRVSPNVANLPLRPPAVLARSAASLDILSGGRVELGLGAGGFWDPVVAMGGPRRDPGEAVAALEEAIRVMRTLWTPGRTERIEGSHYRLAGAKSGPYPVHPIGIWLGAAKPRMLRLVGRLADGWMPSSPWAPPSALAELNRTIDEAAVAAGRAPSDIRRLYNLGEEFSAQQLAELALSEGMSGFIAMLDLDDEKALHRFAEETAPAVREIVAAHRSGTPVAVNQAFDVLPTPDDGRRLTRVTLWDESARPSAPKPEGPVEYSAAGRAQAQHLIEVHDHLRAELAQLRDLIGQVASGVVDAGEARSHINTMTMRQNNWTLGAYCESYCRVLTMHHTAEDALLFPQLRRKEPGLAPVVGRLEQEHHAIAGVLERVDAALVTLAADPTRVDELREAVDILTDALLSHLSYEERQLVEPLARLGIRI
ncbi:LLM class flavin-dependent oxidoreductase [Allorhizocola rhizosphaerae]|uniref:LLM class flavin-dependent oxidoreductase n=1 Tax=Allorhizocola rhizosphaerae TaxID=1872709 RepID=UPI000E3CF61C|nr:LLM class flavin-dependent oxidoreductase [Allorhizocola rhizosphaerae]